MKQKVALTAAHLLAHGRVADMGMGSGAGSHALASLYPSLEVVGVDINATMVELAAERYRLPNLSFVRGDIAGSCFPPDSLDGIFDSSVLHHVTTFGGYRHEAAAEALAVQAAMLRHHGMLIVRDFVDPGEGDVILELPADDGDESDDPKRCSTAALFRRFAREFRKLSDSPGFEYEEVAAPSAARRAFRLRRTLAAEFVLRKDYRNDWETEVLEEYTYFTQRRFEETFAAHGLRILASTPLWNPWIVRNRFEGRVVVRALDGTELDYPPTNYLIAGEKVGPGEGVRFVERAAAPVGFLSLDHYRHRATRRVMDLVRRPHPTIDVVPWFTSAGELFVLARKSYPRPIAGAGDTPTLNGSTPPRYVTEPLNVLQQEAPYGSTVVESIERGAALPADRVRRLQEGCIYYPSPGGVEEQVRSALVEIEPHFEQTEIHGVSRFSSSGHVRAIEATQLLRAAQVGGLSDARMEINVYELLRTTSRDPGPWIGDSIEIASELRASAVDLEALLARPGRRMFEPASADESSRFLEVRCSSFVEFAADGTEVAQEALEYVVPRTMSINTVATALLARSGDTMLIGVDDDDLPAAQSFSGNSDLLVAPAWRLPRSIERRADAVRWILERLESEYRAHAGRVWELGGMYQPSAGLTPERVYPYAFEIDRLEEAAGRSLLWVPITDAIRHAGRLHDGHLRIVLFRAAHALGLL